MSKIDAKHLSQNEGDTLKTIFGTIIDVIVKATGGKPSFGEK